MIEREGGREKGREGGRESDRERERESNFHFYFFQDTLQVLRDIH